MENYQPHFGGAGDLVALLVLAIAGVVIGLLIAAMGIYGWLEHGPRGELYVTEQSVTP